MTSPTPRLHYQTIPVNPFQQNCSIVWCEQTMEAAVIDPGGDLPRIEAAVKALGVDLRQI
ncbi:MAG: MBL fold metallo-hydrolase, partial [Proteobacteria bacterium]|nr:MBL fold metallo-hydrolase [Pseudomonadota bacterium]